MYELFLKDVTDGVWPQDIELEQNVRLGLGNSFANALVGFLPIFQKSNFVAVQKGDIGKLFDGLIFGEEGGRLYIVWLNIVEKLIKPFMCLC